MDLQSLCEAGQRALIETEYLEAEALLAQAESLAWNACDWDTLSRLYMPLQEARRQRRQRCGEGVVRLDLLLGRPGEVNPASAQAVVERYPQGQLLVAGEASIAPAIHVRALARERRLYLETFLAAWYPIGESFVVAVVPGEDVALPPADGRPLDLLLAALPPFSGVLAEADLLKGAHRGSDATYAVTMALWERLHAPFLAAAEATTDPVRRMAEFRRTITVDYACELAHQHLSKTAHVLAKQRRA